MDFNLQNATIDGADVDFLKEVLGDLFTEIEEALVEIQNGIDNKSFPDVKAPSHRVKGSASYLGCEKVQHSAEKLQLQAMKGMESPNDALWPEIIAEFDNFKQVCEACKAAVQETLYK